MIKPCERCGHEFDGHSNAKYCPNCRVEVRREYQRQYREAHRDKCRECVKLWRQVHCEYYREYKRRYYIKLKLEVLRGDNT